MFTGIYAVFAMVWLIWFLEGCGGWLGFDGLRMIWQGEFGGIGGGLGPLGVVRETGGLGPPHFEVLGQKNCPLPS